MSDHSIYGVYAKLIKARETAKPIAKCQRCGGHMIVVDISVDVSPHGKKTFDTVCYTPYAEFDANRKFCQQRFQFFEYETVLKNEINNE